MAFASDILADVPRPGRPHRLRAARKGRSPLAAGGL